MDRFENKRPNLLFGLREEHANFGMANVLSLSYFITPTFTSKKVVIQE